MGGSTNNSVVGANTPRNGNINSIVENAANQFIEVHEINPPNQIIEVHEIDAPIEAAATPDNIVNNQGSGGADDDGVFM